MTDLQWSQLLQVVQGQTVDTLPNWHGIEILDYFSSDHLWLEANRHAIMEFPEMMFLPGFWSEFGMCTEPSAFGARGVFPRNEFPFADRVIRDPAQIDDVVPPNPGTDGLLPFILNRLRLAQPSIEDMGHRIRFSVSRGPLNIATFLMGTTEFLMLLKTEPEQAHQLLRKITDFLLSWHSLQRATFASIDGIMLLDDIVGFIGETHFKEFGMPYLRELFAAEVSVKFFHNDAECARSIRYYSQLGINLYNPGIFNSLAELRTMSDSKLAILGTIPPREVLAQGSPTEVAEAVRRLLQITPDKSRLVLSCAGGMPPGVRTENLQAFVSAARAAGFPSA
jgi:uroporphyrinogen decarboxylase